MTASPTPPDAAPDDPAPNAPTRRKRGAPPGNMNGLKRGYLSNKLRHGLVVGTLPKGMMHIERSVSKLRNVLEQSVIALRGEVSIVDATAINTACRFETHACLALSMLRKGFADMTYEQKLSYSRDVAYSSERRDKAIDRLRLRVPRSDAIASFYDRDLSLDEPTGTTAGTGDHARDHDPQADGDSDADDRDANDHAPPPRGSPS